MSLFYLPRALAFDADGRVVSGAKLDFYEANTSTRKDTFSDVDLTTPNLNPVVANSSGLFGPIYLEDGSYKVVLSDADDVVIWTQDYIVVGIEPDDDIPEGSLTNAMLADMAQATIKGRASGAGTGAPTDLTATQAAAIVKPQLDLNATDVATTRSTSVTLVTRQAHSIDAGATVDQKTAGDWVVVYNRSGSNITLTQGAGVTLRLSGTATSGNRTLAQRTLCVLWWDSATEVVASGSGVS